MHCALLSNYGTVIRACALWIISPRARARVCNNESLYLNQQNHKRYVFTLKGGINGIEHCDLTLDFTLE